MIFIPLTHVKGVKKRGDDYKELKDCIGHQMVEHTLKLFPELRDKIDYVEIGEFNFILNIREVNLTLF